MKLPLTQTVLLLGLASVLSASDLTTMALTKTDEVEVKQKLKAYESGKITLEELTEKGGAEWDRKLITYYLSHTNEVAVTMKLPIGRCFAVFGSFPEAARLAEDYVQVYSNDWRGWKIVGVANFSIGNFDRALVACTNAVKLGNEGSYGPLAFVALKLDRLDIVRDIVPRLLELKNATPTKEIKPLDIVLALVLYSLKADQPDVFVKAVNGVNIKDIMRREDLKHFVSVGCEQFKSKEVQKICQQIEAAEQSGFNTEKK